ncbi:hypothetical protein HPP92_019215 [Vanilla planifolia]|uniref:Uncharacterized protein n=1 Tax=Vanilla planifolia TaxID=51239 RepID=A0A835Q2H2_VANPL|nr:hypothetical protein HPP92_019215 [Vanilla planifolia]
MLSPLISYHSLISQLANTLIIPFDHLQIPLNVKAFLSFLLETFLSLHEFHYVVATLLETSLSQINPIQEIYKIVQSLTKTILQGFYQPSSQGLQVLLFQIS